MTPGNGDSLPHERATDQPIRSRDTVVRLGHAGWCPVISLAGSRSTGLMLWWNPFDGDDLATVEHRIAAGTVRPVIDRRFQLSEIVTALR